MNLFTNRWSPTSSVGIIEPEGILNAWMTKEIMKPAISKAIRIDSMNSRIFDLTLTGADLFSFMMFNLSFVSGGIFFSGENPGQIVGGCPEGESDEDKPSGHRKSCGCFAKRRDHFFQNVEKRPAAVQHRQRQ